MNQSVPGAGRARRAPWVGARPVGAERSRNVAELEGSQSAPGHRSTNLFGTGKTAIKATPEPLRRPSRRPAFAALNNPNHDQHQLVDAETGTTAKRRFHSPGERAERARRAPARWASPVATSRLRRRRQLGLGRAAQQLGSLGGGAARAAAAGRHRIELFPFRRAPGFFNFTATDNLAVAQKRLPAVLHRRADRWRACR